VGPHENALQTYTNQRGPQFPGEKGPRRDLIFKTPEGEPKTTATGLKYDLSQARETYAQNQGVPLMAGGKFKPVEVGKIFEEQSRNYVNAVDTALKCMLRRVV